MLDKNAHIPRVREGDVNFGAEGALILASSKGLLDPPFGSYWGCSPSDELAVTFLTFQRFSFSTGRSLPPSGLSALSVRDLRAAVSLAIASQSWIGEICRLVRKRREI